MSQSTASPQTIDEVFEAIRVNNRERLKELLDENPALIRAVKEGKTPLHSAAYWNKAEIARLLIQSGADVNALTDDKWAMTPLHTTAGNTTGDTTRVLVEAGADLEIADKVSHYTPLVEAADRACEGPALVLIEAGANVAYETPDGFTALRCALDNPDGSPTARQIIAAALKARGARRTYRIPSPEELYQALESLVGQLDASIVGSAAGEDLKAFKCPASDTTLAALLKQEAWLTSASEGDYEDAVNEHAGDAAASILDPWNAQLEELKQTCSEVQFLSFRNYCDPRWSEYDDELFLVAVQSPDGSWWVVGPQFGDPENHRSYGPPLEVESEATPAPDWLKPLTELKVLMTYGQEACLTGGLHSSSATPSVGPLLAVSGPSRNVAIDRYLLSSRFLATYRFTKLQNDTLTNFLTENFELVHLYVLGHYSNYSHFFVATCRDGKRIGFMANASWA